MSFQHYSTAQNCGHFQGHAPAKTRNTSLQVPTKTVRNHVEKQRMKWRDQREEWVVEIRAYHWRKKTGVAGTSIKKRIPEYLVRLYSGNWRQEETGTANEKHGHWTLSNEIRRYGLYLGWSQRTDDKQSWLASMCGPMHPAGCGMN